MNLELYVGSKPVPLSPRELWRWARRQNEGAGYYFFERGRKVLPKIYGPARGLRGFFFITRDPAPYGRDAYTVREFQDSGYVATRGRWREHATRAAAVRAARLLVRRELEERRSWGHV